MIAHDEDGQGQGLTLGEEEQSRIPHNADQSASFVGNYYVIGSMARDPLFVYCLFHYIDGKVVKRSIDKFPALQGHQDLGHVVGVAVIIAGNHLLDFSDDVSVLKAVIFYPGIDLVFAQGFYEYIGGHIVTDADHQAHELAPGVLNAGLFVLKDSGSIYLGAGTPKQIILRESMYFLQGPLAMFNLFQEHQHVHGFLDAGGVDVGVSVVGDPFLGGKIVEAGHQGGVGRQDCLAKNLLVHLVNTNTLFICLTLYFYICRDFTCFTLAIDTYVHCD